MKWFSFVCVLFFAACTRQPAAGTDASSSGGETAAPAAERPTPAEPPAPAARPPSSTGTIVDVVEEQKEITIENVGLGNPLTISGRARTFENNVVLRARDAKGALITEGFTTANGDMGHHNPYRGSLFLTRHPGNRIIVEALEYSAKDGSERSLVRAERPFAVETVAARLFFPDQSCTGVKPYTRRIPKTVSMARLLVEALIAGPIASEKQNGAAAPFPKGSAVQSVNLRDGTLTVDFNDRLRNVGGSCQAQMIRAAVTQTLGALPTVKKVVITAGGSEALALQP
ncbi:MAG TPA: GerMN domain-containing protein [Thermoanaerobaculia bacterium]|nr:GerMN domain-containing protein [Thermoanaerobaculia bacterium]